MKTSRLAIWPSILACALFLSTPASAIDGPPPANPVEIVGRLDSLSTGAGSITVDDRRYVLAPQVVFVAQDGKTPRTFADVVPGKTVGLVFTDERVTRIIIMDN